MGTQKKERYEFKKMDSTKMTSLNRKENRGKIAIFQIMILVIGIMAFGFMLGNDIGLVSAKDTSDGGSCDNPGDYREKDGTTQYCNDNEEWKDATYDEGYTGKTYEGEEIDVPDQAGDKGKSGVMNWVKGVGSVGGTFLTIEKAGQKLGWWGEEAAKELAKETASQTANYPPQVTRPGGGIGIDNPGTGLFSSGFWGGTSEGFSMVQNVGWGSSGALNYVLASYATAAISAAIVVVAFEFAGAGDRNMEEVIKGGIFSAGGTGTTATVIALATGSGPPGWAIAIVAAAAAGIYGLFNYQKFAQEQVTFLPGAWTPVDGGDHCEECNELEYGCSEYQCHTYGKSCDIINKGTDKEKCVHINPNDTSAPKMSALDSALQDDFEYVPLDQLSPPDRGVKIVQKSGEEKIPPYTALTLGVNTSEPAECRMDIERKDNYEDMMTSISQGYQQYEHPFSIPHSAMQSNYAVEKSFKGNESNMSEEYKNMLEDFDFEEANDHTFYVRCKDSNGNIASLNFVIEVDVEDSPDTQAPEIISTNYDEESYVGFNKSSYPITVTTNEPATCRWNRKDTSYENMEYNITEKTGETLGRYEYRGEFTGVKDREENTFYIRCQDKPNWDEDTDDGKPFANKESEVITLIGTEPLLIDEATVNGETNGTTIKDSTDEVMVDFEIKTSSGANHGKSKCYYGEEKGNENIEFYNDGEGGYTQTNIQEDLSFTEGDYTYYFKCVDEGGNTARTNLSFTVETDRESPEIVRASKGDEKLNLITSEEGECVYSTRQDRGCTYSYDEGSSMTASSDGKTHSTEWSPDETFYVKCKDKYGNRPMPDECSMIVRPYEV